MLKIVMVVAVVAGSVGVAHADGLSMLAGERDALMRVADAQPSVVRRDAPVAWTVMESNALAVSTVLLAADWLQTRSAAREGWSHKRTEGNPIIRRMDSATPSTRTVDAYFAATIVANAAIWYVAPKLVPARVRHVMPWRTVVPAAITVVQARQVYSNIATTSAF